MSSALFNLLHASLLDLDEILEDLRAEVPSATAAAEERHATRLARLLHLVVTGCAPPPEDADPDWPNKPMAERIEYALDFVAAEEDEQFRAERACTRRRRFRVLPGGHPDGH